VRKSRQQSPSWANIPLVATVARLLCRELTLQNEYLRKENKVLRSKVKGRIRFNDGDRRLLVDAALARGRKLMRQVVTIVRPETILAWQRRLEREKWDYSKRPRRAGRPRTSGELRSIPRRFAQVVSEVCVEEQHTAMKRGRKGPRCARPAQSYLQTSAIGFGSAVPHGPRVTPLAY